MSQSKYDREFKEQVVQRIVRGETTTIEMAQNLDLHYTTVRGWVRQYKKEGSSAFPGSGNLKDEDAEIRKLRKELLELKDFAWLLYSIYTIIPSQDGLWIVG